MKQETRITKTTCPRCGGKTVVANGHITKKPKQCPMCLDPDTKMGTGEITKLIKV